MNRLIDLFTRRQPDRVYLRPEIPTLRHQPRHWVALVKALAERPVVGRHQVQAQRQD